MRKEKPSVPLAEPINIGNYDLDNNSSIGFEAQSILGITFRGLTCYGGLNNKSSSTCFVTFTQELGQVRSKE